MNKSKKSKEEPKSALQTLWSIVIITGKIWQKITWTILITKNQLKSHSSISHGWFLEELLLCALLSPPDLFLQAFWGNCNYSLYTWTTFRPTDYLSSWQNISWLNKVTFSSFVQVGVEKKNPSLVAQFVNLFLTLGKRKNRIGNFSYSSFWGFFIFTWPTSSCNLFDSSRSVVSVDLLFLHTNTSLLSKK